MLSLVFQQNVILDGALYLCGTCSLCPSESQTNPVGEAREAFLLADEQTDRGRSSSSWPVVGSWESKS